MMDKMCKTTQADCCFICKLKITSNISSFSLLPCVRQRPTCNYNERCHGFCRAIYKLHVTQYDLRQRTARCYRVLSTHTGAEHGVCRVPESDETKRWLGITKPSHMTNKALQISKKEKLCIVAFPLQRLFGTQTYAAIL
jgi:hypothetical protein